MRVLHWLYWQFQTLWLCIGRLAGASSDDWNPRLYPDEQLAWEAFQRARRRRAAGGSSSNVISVPVTKPIVRSAPPLPADPADSAPPPAVIRRELTWDELEGEEKK
jgi:hypothetical protein